MPRDLSALGIEKHCFVPCPPDQCDCGKNGPGRMTREETERAAREFKIMQVETLLAQGKNAEALAISLSL